MEKLCSKCQEQKPITEFRLKNKEKQYYDSWCHSCAKESRDAAVRRALERRKDFVRNAKNRPCQDCGNSYPYWVMQFDHVRGEKLFTLNQVYAHGMEAVRAEVEKCEVVCANCHADRTHTRKYLTNPETKG